MKKLALLLFLILLTPAIASAQKGMHGVGVNASLSAYNEFSVGAGIKYQYHYSDNWRIEPSFTYYFEAYEESVLWAGAVNAHYLIGARKPLRPYIGLGLGISQVRGYTDGYSDSAIEEVAALSPCLDLGLDWRLSHALSFQAEIKAIYYSSVGGRSFEMDEDFGGFAGILNIGLTYNF